MSTATQGRQPMPTPAMLRARERAHEWGQRYRENGRCPKHTTPVSRLSHCHQCQPADSPPSGRDSAHPVPQPGDRLTSCFRCEHCERHYHAGSIYIYKRPESLRKKHGIHPGPNNCLFNYDDVRKPGDNDMVLSLCGECAKEGGGKWEYHNRLKWKGRCRRHIALGRRETKRWRHITGAIVLPSKRSSERGVRKRMTKVAFICANRKKTVHGRHLGETYLSQTKRDDWRGLCTDCQRRFVDPKKKLADEKIEGALLAFSEPDEEGRVPIVYDGCKHRRYAPRQTALGYLWKGRVSGLCLNCRNGNGQKNATEEKPRRRGRPPTITEGSLRTSFRKLGRYATQEQTAECLEVSDRALREWQERNGLSFREVQERYSSTGSN